MDLPLDQPNVEIKVVGYRWVQLIIFCLFTVISFMQCMQFTIIANVITKYYNVDSSVVDITALILFVVYIILGIPVSYLIERYNLKVTAVVATFLTLAGNIVKIFCVDQSRFYLILIGQTLCALGQVGILTIPTKFASVWFGPEEVSTACAFSFLGVQLGSGLGAMIPPFLVSKENSDEEIGHGIYVLTLSYAIATAVIFIIVILFFRARPNLPPSMSQMQLLTQSEERPNYFQTCKTLFKNKDFLLIIMIFGMTSGIWNSFGITINRQYLYYFPNYLPGSSVKTPQNPPNKISKSDGDKNGARDVGIISLLSILSGGCIGSVLWGFILDKTHEFKKTSFAVLSLICVSFVGMVASLMLQNRILTFFTIPAFGFFCASSLIIGFEYALEVTYPIPESISCSVLNAVIFLFAIIGTFIQEVLIENVGYLYFFVFLLLSFTIPTLFVFCMSSNLKRREANLAINTDNRVNHRALA